MQKNDLDGLVNFWEGIEQNFIEKAKHLMGHAEEWIKEHGPLSDKDPRFNPLSRMIYVAQHGNNIRKFKDPDNE